ncbi:EF-hand domain-containing protein [[Candida] zeylanoides]
MPGDDLPSYPTPQQAVYHADHQNPRKQKPYQQQAQPSVTYRPPPPPQNMSHKSQAPPQQQRSYSYQQGPPQQQMQHYNQAPPPPQTAYSQHYQAPPPQHPQQPQQYYQPAPAHNSYSSSPSSMQYSQHHQQQQQQQHPHMQQQQQQSPQQSQQYTTQSPRYDNFSEHTVSKKPPPQGYTSPPVSQSMARKSSRPQKEPSQEYAPPVAQVSAKQKLESELHSVFDKVDTNRSGRISASELSSALLNFDHTRFQDSTILLMIKLFAPPDAAERSLNFDQFVSLWKYLSAYKKLFIAADVDKSGDISFGEFQKILEQIGYKLNVDLVLNLFQKFSNRNMSSHCAQSMTIGKLKFDAFIELLVYLRKLTDVFKKYDKDLSGVATINFSDFLLEMSNLT